MAELAPPANLTDAEFRAQLEHAANGLSTAADDLMAKIYYATGPEAKAALIEDAAKLTGGYKVKPQVMRLFNAVRKGHEQVFGTAVQALFEKCMQEGHPLQEKLLERLIAIDPEVIKSTEWTAANSNSERIQVALNSESIPLIA